MWGFSTSCPHHHHRWASMIVYAVNILVRRKAWKLFLCNYSAHTACGNSSCMYAAAGLAYACTLDGRFSTLNDAILLHRWPRNFFHIIFMYIHVYACVRCEPYLLRYINIKYDFGLYLPLFPISDTTCDRLHRAPYTVDITFIRSLFFFFRRNVYIYIIFYSITYWALSHFTGNLLQLFHRSIVRVRARFIRTWRI